VTAALADPDIGSALSIVQYNTEIYGFSRGYSLVLTGWGAILRMIQCTMPLKYHKERAMKPGQRGFKRRSSFIIVEYKVREGVFRDIIKNIGPGGIYVGTQRAIAGDQDISLKFPLFSFERQIEAKGRVVRSGPHGFAVTLDPPIDRLIRKDGGFAKIVHEIDRA
jgi:hypothetical protein